MHIVEHVLFLPLYNDVQIYDGLSHKIPPEYTQVCTFNSGNVEITVLQGVKP